MRGSPRRLLVQPAWRTTIVIFTNTTLLIPALVASGALFDTSSYPAASRVPLTFRDTGIHGWQTILDFFDRSL